MQTFLPYKSFQRSAKCLDWRRLGKQRTEAKQILDINKQGPEIAYINISLDGKIKKKAMYGWPLNSGDGIMRTSWYNHPAVKMWRNFAAALEAYKNVMIKEWIKRGYNNNMPLTYDYSDFKLPHWLNKKFCLSHRSNLLRKKPNWYSRFNWNIPNNLPYIWPDEGDET